MTARGEGRVVDPMSLVMGGLALLLSALVLFISLSQAD